MNIDRVSFFHKVQFVNVILCILVLFATGPAGGAERLKGHWLLNGSFEEKIIEPVPESWEIKNRKLANYRVEKAQDAKMGNIFYVKLARSSNYEKTFIISQQLDIAALRGKVVSFGGNIKTSGAKVYLRLWSPQGNSEIIVKDAPAYRHVRKEFSVPESASFILFGVEVIGSRGDEAWMDDLFVGEPITTASTTMEKVVNTINIDPSRNKVSISPLKFGAHIEWIRGGHGVWDAKKRALDRKVIEMLKPLKIPVWRFPGGIYSDYYDWKDGITGYASRPYGLDPFDQKTRLRHDFGTDEFIKFLHETNSEALITANYGTGSMKMAVEWLRYFKNKGVKVRYWEIGNEVYMADPKDHNAANGARIFHTAEQYTEDFVRWADALKAVDPDVRVGAIGGIDNAHQSNRNWMDTLLKGAGQKMDFIALHNSFAPVILGRFDYESGRNRLKAYKAMLAQVEYVKSDIAAVKKKIRLYVPSRAADIKIAVTEHFPIFGVDDGSAGRSQLLQNIDQTRTMAGALYTATLLTALLNDQQIFMMNYLNPIHQYYGAFLNKSEEGIVKNPVYYVYYMYRNFFGEELIFSEFKGKDFSSSAVGMIPLIRSAPILEVAAALKDDGAITVAVVNKDLENAQPAIINIAGVKGALQGEIFSLSGDSPNAVTAPLLSKSTKRQGTMKILQKYIKLDAAGVVTFPAGSFNILRIGKVEGH